MDLAKEQCTVYRSEFIFKSRDLVEKIIDQLHLSKCIPVRV